MENWRKRVVVGVAGLALAFSSPKPALAHAHLFNDSGSPTIETAYPIDDITSQRGLYGSLLSPGSVDFYRIDVLEARSMSVWLTVPQSENCLSFRPQLAIIGVNAGALVEVPGVTIPEGMAATVLASPLWGRYVDPDTRLGYFAGPRAFPDVEAGTYYFAVFDVEGRTGSYLLLTGEIDVAGGDSDWLARASDHHLCRAGAQSS